MGTDVKLYEVPNTQKVVVKTPDRIPILYYDQEIRDASANLMNKGCRQNGRVKMDFGAALRHVCYDQNHRHAHSMEKLNSRWR